MINLLSIRCSLAFAPYLLECFDQFGESGTIRPFLVRQGSLGLTARSESALVIRHQGCEVKLDRMSVPHFLATISFRASYYHVVRMSSEIVMASAPPYIFVSFPQSELWLMLEDVDALLNLVEGAETVVPLPEWLVASSSGGSLLLSDQRNGRWVLMSTEHLEELQKRRGQLSLAGGSQSTTAEKPPKLEVKGIDLPLQVAFEVADALDQFASTNRVTRFEEQTSLYNIAVRPSSEGLELCRSERRVGFNKREAVKWTLIIREELNRVNATRVQRGQIRTVAADGESGRWILQFGDVVLFPSPQLVVDRGKEWLLALDPGSGSCVALGRGEDKLVDR